MKKKALYLLAAVVSMACSQPKQVLTVSVGNDLPFNRSGELV